MPVLDGGEVLEAISADPALRHLTVVVQTTSESDVDLVKTWELGAVHFVRKPLDVEKIAAIVAGRGGRTVGMPW
jgi:two-component system response regulator